MACRAHHGPVRFAGAPCPGGRRAGDREALKRLGTYGFIKGATGFLVGAVRRAPRDAEDYGYLVEQAILHATGLGLGTCWLGGTFTRQVRGSPGRPCRDEIMPAVISLGYPADDGAARVREREAGSRRLPASSLFFDERFDAPLALASGDPFAATLEAVRMAPSASNKQPWRLVRRGADWHFSCSAPKATARAARCLRFCDSPTCNASTWASPSAISSLLARELGLSGDWVFDGPSAEAVGPARPHRACAWSTRDLADGARLSD